MIRVLVNGEHIRRAFGLAAAVIFLIQVLAAGAAAPTMPQRPVATASQHQTHGEHHPGQPADQDGAPHCSWCILCGKLGVAVGTPPTPVAVLLPDATHTAPVAVGGLEQGAGRSYAVLPLGARAPPRLV